MPGTFMGFARRTLLMRNHLLILAPKHLRATDSNSLLRLYDQVAVLLRQAQSGQDRLKAQRTIQRLRSELHKRRLRP
jgi:hypothetical protein